MPKQIDVCLSFDFDAMALWIGGFHATSLSAISRGEFGRVGAERILAMLREFDIRATWFIPGHTADSFPAIVERIAAAGHEIGNHGYSHERPASPEDDCRGIDRGSESIRRIIGVAPRGYRAAGGSLIESTLKHLLERGFLYDSSLLGNDFSPYYCRAGDRAQIDQPYAFGREVDLVEIPFSWELDDFPAFEYVNTRHGVQQGLASPSDVYEIWAGDFDYLYDRIGEGVFTLTMHPQVIGRGHRMLMLERLLNHIRERDGVRFTTMSEVATAWKSHHPLGEAP